MEESEFNGLTMPVFAAFGWAGEEAALNYAFEQLELFVKLLHKKISHGAQEMLPVYGVSREGQSVYLAMDSDVEANGFIAFNARPLSFEIQMGVKNKAILARGLAQIGQDFVESHRVMAGLGPQWTLRVQQMQIDDDTGEALHYQDLYKDSLQALDMNTFQEVFSKATYLNGEERWITPVYLSLRIPSEHVAAMGKQVVQVISEYVMNLLPVLRLLTAQKPKRRVAARKAKSKRTSSAASKKAVPVPALEAAKDGEGFDYVATLKGLHIRRGFINLTPRHWPFFAINSRTETRPVTVYYNGVYDKDCAVWRLVANDQARIVLSPAVHAWLEDEFSPEDQIQVQVRKLADDEIQITLTPVA
ncbi:MAG: hypothetical protein Kow0080_06570 [Candidatus Promineifilaceae bacterium]